MRGISLAGVALLLVAAAVVGQPAAPEKLPLEELLAKALQHSPDVQVAEAKVREAEAVLRQTRLNVAQKLVEMHTAAGQQQAVLANVEKDYKKLAELNRTGSVSAVEVSASERRLLELKGQLALVEAQVNALTGRLPALASVPGQLRPAVNSGVNEDPKYREPMRAMADRMLTALDQPMKLPEKMDGMTLQGLVEYLRGQTGGVPILNALKEAGEAKVELDFRGEITLAGCFQLLSDTYGVNIVVRDYGFMIFSNDRVVDDGMPVLDFWTAGNKARQKAAVGKPI